ncbi:argininosuccinate lyase [Thalassobacillus hwangdonensis]|uniref:Argininosuccinate lyase n=1 Tax=Thalassobacillus hwangdonensis TaxID=546108 RepID=A0ABW3L2B2_9BACI
MKLWGGRFTKETNALMEEYTASIGFDHKLASYDIEGSIAHVTMLGECGILTDHEADEIVEGLNKVQQKILAGEVTWNVSHEDIHMNIESLLKEEIGPLSGKLHTGRSRNDQVALDMRMYARDQVADLVDGLVHVQQALINQAIQNTKVVFPGYTHLQRAQPILFSHHMLAYVAMLQRDIERLQDSWKRINQLPLGAGALAGTTFPIDRDRVAELLGFEGLCENSLDAVSDRDFVVEFLSNGSLIITHLSRLCEELVLWSSQEFQFIELDDAFTTGSSMMPQKKNPDVAELVRGKTGRVYGNLIGMLTTLKALPLAYNKDMQEDKEGMFDTAETLSGALALFAPMIETMEVKEGVMRQAVTEDFSNATDLADYLVGKGVPFREAHAIVGETVLYCIEKGFYLLDLSLQEFRKFSEAVDDDVYHLLAPEQVVEARNVQGGTAYAQVMQQLFDAEKKIQASIQWLQQKQSK